MDGTEGSFVLFGLMGASAFGRVLGGLFGVLAGVAAVFVGGIRMFLRFGVLTEIVAEGRLKIVMRGGVVACGGLLVMLARRMGRGLRHGWFSFLNIDQWCGFERIAFDRRSRTASE